MSMLGRDCSDVHEYFSERELGPQARTEEVVSATAWGGIVSLVSSLISTGAFGAKYPDACPDGLGTVGTDEQALSLAVSAEMPGLPWPLQATERVAQGFFPENRATAPSTLLILDFIEFCHRTVAQPTQRSFHSFFGHYHLSFDEVAGKKTFRNDVNRIFSRNNLAYELSDSGQVVRLAPPILREELREAVFRTGDPTLDRMLGQSREKYLRSDPEVRRESLERLWDCWERLKSMQNPENKRKSVESLISRAANQLEFRQVLEKEAAALTRIGNSFHIRHSEVTQSMVTEPKQIDYLFHRLFALIQLLLSRESTLEGPRNQPRDATHAEPPKEL